MPRDNAVIWEYGGSKRIYATRQRRNMGVWSRQTIEKPCPCLFLNNYFNANSSLNSKGDWDTDQGDAYASECPATHPVRIPEVHFYFRILDYEVGGG